MYGLKPVPSKELASLKGTSNNQRSVTGAKAHILFVMFSARLKSCPDTD